MSETDQQGLIRAYCARNGIQLERNNVGACRDENGRIIRYGIGNDSAQLQRRYKSSDLIGDYQGRYMAVECKALGWTNPFPDDAYWKGKRSTRKATDREFAQYTFLQHKRARGCIAFFATEPEDVRRTMIEYGVGLCNP